MKFGRGRRGRAHPSAFHTLSLNRGATHFTLGHVLSHPSFYKYNGAPLPNYPVAPLHPLHFFPPFCTSLFLLFTLPFLTFLTFPLHPYVRPLVSWLVGRSVGWSVRHNLILILEQLFMCLFYRTLSVLARLEERLHSTRQIMWPGNNFFFKVKNKKN